MCLAVPGKIVDIYDSADMRMCKVDFGGVTREVCLQALPDAKIGDYTIVHAGFALNVLSASEAKETLDALRELGEIEGDMDFGEK